jgi:hypothetical protein
LWRCSGALERAGLGYELIASRAPTRLERETLEARAVVLETALRPAGVEEALRLVAALFATIPSGRGEAETTREQIKLYAGLLGAHPAFAVASACRGVVEAGDRFRPAAGELVVRARQAGTSARAEAGEIRRLLDARIVRDVAPEERARVGAGFREMRAALEEA